MSLIQLYHTQADVLISGRRIAILDLIHSAGPEGQCVAEMERIISEEVGESPRLATIYELVMRLEKQGLVRKSGQTQDTAGRPRNLFVTTGRGELVLSLGRELFSKEELTQVA